MKKGRVTIKDIARELNIAPSTVSRALNDHPAIKKETKDAVKALAEELDYQPNLLALNLLQKKSNTIGVIVPEITGHFFSAIITGIQDVIVNSEFNIMICLSNESYEEEMTIVKKLSKIQIDGVLVSPSSETKNFDHFRRLQKSGIPVVVFDRDCPGLEADKVLVDDYHGAFQAVEYLIGTGCKNIAHLGGPLNLSTTEHRLQGYLDALEKNNIPVNGKHIVHVPGFSHKDGIKPTKKLLELKERPDAIFAYNDNIAISAMHIAKKMGLKIPEEVSVLGFDDEPHSSFITPSLSTVWQPVYSMGMLSARILLSHLNNKNTTLEFRKEVFKPELVIRASSKAN
ncbi:LacI family DNA-binding transcriptional regulator [Arenibacter sp. BSSL-BM3]|uniref:LacI family DNA-binding transcriptional regulator n=1 Tax=Arenibacter arenosicollis TaxID=2762274 RepID=A0ABR7QMH4_9FLAO|nr:LacI family DNA-binding transcriptional regulator [Arenibacter arenosicollis]MBC8768358.1 LacI family DNA-binding transcriptional regulator [Arenibacter arenosicollis]